MEFTNIKKLNNLKHYGVYVYKCISYFRVCLTFNIQYSKRLPVFNFEKKKLMIIINASMVLYYINLTGEQEMQHSIFEKKISLKYFMQLKFGGI